jgi:hypothetical protein
MDEQLLQRLEHEFADHDDIQALIAATRSLGQHCCVRDTVATPDICVRHQASMTRADELAEVHAVLDDYGVPRVLRAVLRSDWSYHPLPARAAERLRRLHWLMATYGQPDFMYPESVIDPPDS